MLSVFSEESTSGRQWALQVADPEDYGRLWPPDEDQSLQLVRLGVAGAESEVTG